MRWGKSRWAHGEGFRLPKQAALLSLTQKFFERDPVAAARSLETMDEAEAVQVLAALSPSLSAQVFPHLSLDHAAKLLPQVPPEPFRAAIERLNPEQAASIFRNFPGEVRARMLESLSDEAKRRIQEFIAYPEDSAGRIMSTDFLSFHTDVQVKDAVHRIRQLAQKKDLASYVYVVDTENRLVGVMNMRDLLLASGDTPLGAIMRKEIFSVNGFMDREEVANRLSRKGYFAAPVVDAEGRLLGVVKSERLIREVQEEGAEDLQKVFGVNQDERISSPFGFSLRLRLPWLHINLVTAFLAAAVVALFEPVIAQVTVLAVFLPVVAGQGGNAGAQSLAVVMRGLVMREIPQGKVLRTLLKETVIGAVNGVVIGVVVALVSWAWKGNPFLGLVVGLGMVVNLIVAGFAGAAIPLTLKALGRDPAQSANIILTTITDVVGFFAFLGFAVLFQRRLVP